MNRELNSNIQIEYSNKEHNELTTDKSITVKLKTQYIKYYLQDVCIIIGLEPIDGLKAKWQYEKVFHIF